MIESCHTLECGTRVRLDCDTPVRYEETYGEREVRHSRVRLKRERETASDTYQ